MQRAMARISAALVFVYLCSISSQTQDEKPPSERVRFAVEERPRGHLRIEPIATVGDGKLVRFPSSCMEEISENQERQAASNYLASGQTYMVLYGGAQVGQVRLAERLSGLGAAKAFYEGAVKIRGQVRAN
jgi:hypothetical protein